MRMQMSRNYSLCPKNLIREEVKSDALRHDNRTVPCPKKIDRIHGDNQNSDINGYVVGLHAQVR